MREYFKGAKNMILAHILAYDKIHEMRNMAGFKDTAVGAAYHMRVYDPKNNKKGEQWAANNVENLFQEIFVTGMTEGKFGFPLGAGNYPLGKGVFSDFLGINYYTRDMVTVNSNPGTLFANLETNPDAPHNDLGWEIYPEGLYRITKKYFQKYYIPIYITENGTCDAKDAFRSRYIYDHLYQIHRLLDEGINVQRYYHWSTLDNFEWLEGLSARFGLVEVDYANQKRSLRKSGEFYGEICKRKGVNQRMIDKYLK